MAEAAKYMFDRSFDTAARRAGQDGSDSARERQLAETRSAAFEEGREKGRQEALESLQTQANAQVGELAESMQVLLGRVESECAHIRRNALQIGIETANLLAGALIARFPTLKLEALFRDALDYAGGAPHIALTVNDALAESVEKAVKAAAAERGFDGKIAVLGDPGTRKGDGALQWADGGVTLDFEKTRAAVAEAVRRHLDGQAPRNGATVAAAQTANGHGANGASAPRHQPEPENVPGSMTGTGDPR